MENEIVEVTAIVAGRTIRILNTKTGVEMNYVSNGDELVKFCNEHSCKLTNKSSFVYRLQKSFSL